MEGYPSWCDIPRTDSLSCFSLPNVLAFWVQGGDGREDVARVAAYEADGRSMPHMHCAAAHEDDEWVGNYAFVALPRDL